MEPETSIMPQKRGTSTAASLISGSMGGMAQVLVGQPLDTIKTRAQTATRGQFKGPLDIAMQTIKKEGFFALYKGESFPSTLGRILIKPENSLWMALIGMASPLIGIAGVNSLLFASNNYARKLVSPFPDLSIPQIMLAGSMAGAVQAVLASPVEMFKVRLSNESRLNLREGLTISRSNEFFFFQVRMQANQSTTPKRLKEVVGEMYEKYGWKKGIMRGYWVCSFQIFPDNSEQN